MEEQGPQTPSAQQQEKKMEEKDDLDNQDVQALSKTEDKLVEENKSNMANTQSKMNMSFDEGLAGPYHNLQGGLSTLQVQPQNQMMKAFNQYKIAQQQQIEIKARIIKLRKEEEKASKRIKDTMHKADFVENMHKFKFDKMQSKK
jgi:hypothetical protein